MQDEERDPPGARTRRRMTRGNDRHRGREQIAGHQRKYIPTEHNRKNGAPIWTKKYGRWSVSVDPEDFIEVMKEVIRKTK
jgi:hypothetical protein